MGTIRILGDLAVKEKELAEGKITQEEYQKYFERTRFHGVDGSIHPFAVGGSDAAIIMGESPWKTPLRLYQEKFGLCEKPKETLSTEMRLLAGHIFEGPVRELFAKKTGLRVEPCTLQVSNDDYPHLVANIDGLVWENGEMGIYEGKTTSPFSNVKEQFKKGEVPLYYEMQIQFYMEVWNVNFAYINCAWGLNWDLDMKHIRVERNHEMGKELCNACEKFVIDAMNGIRPTNDNVSHANALARDNEILFGTPDNTVPPVDIPKSYLPSFEQLDRLAEQKQPLKENRAELDKEIKRIEKEESQILGIFTSIIGNGTKGRFQIGDDVYTINYEPPSGYSLDAEVKHEWKEKYPESYAYVTSIKPSSKRKLSYEKSKAN